MGAKEAAMFRRSVITYLRLLVFLPTIGVLWGTQPGYTQVTLPTDFISPNVPHDVPAGSTASIQDLAIFAWQEFIALNWVAMDPATTMTRGRPDLNADFFNIQPDSDGNFPLVVWHTYQHKNEMFPASGTTLANFDTSKPTYDYSPQPTPANESTSLDFFNNLDEGSEIGLAFMFSHYDRQHGPHPCRVRGEGQPLVVQLSKP